jgi:hypothetical protein
MLFTQSNFAKQYQLENDIRALHQKNMSILLILTALRNDFKGLRGSILHRFPLPSIDSIVSELLNGEIQL